MFEKKLEKLESARSHLTGSTYTPKMVSEAGIRINQDGNKRTGMDVLAFPDVSFEDVVHLIPELADVDPDIRRQVERDALYANYIDRQNREIEALRRDEMHAIPDDFAYEGIEGLSTELQQKLTRVRPQNLAQASRVDGMTPAALALLLARIRKEGANRSKMA